MQIMPGCPADRDGTLQLGDVIVGVDGVDISSVDGVKTAMVKAKAVGLMIRIRRKQVLVLKTGGVRMRFDTNSSYIPFSLTLSSNRVLAFESQTLPPSSGNIDLFHLLDTQLKTVDRRMVLRLAFEDYTIEFFADSMTDLYEWEEFTSIAGGFNHRLPPAHAGWLHVLNGAKAGYVQPG